MTGENRPHLTEEELHGLADGTLAAGGRPSVAAHVEGCAECAGLVERLRRLLAATDAVPRSIEPPRDLWPEIRRRIRGESPRASDRPHGWRYYGRFAAAAVVLVVASSLLTRAAMLKGSQSGLPSTTGGVPVAGTFTPVSEYDRLDRELAALLAAHRRTLSPATIATVERNLAIIDQAIAEIRAALVEDPANPALHDLLKSSYGQKQALLRQISST